MAIDKIFNDANVDGIADNIFGAVNNSVSEVKQMQQRKAAENVQMVIQALKKIESDLRQTNEEVANELATRIASIKDGKDGKDGNNAKDGRDGRPGRDGAKGDKGDRGLDGRNGIDGKDGVSVTDAKIDFDGSLIISLSTGQEINVGEVVSPDLADKIQVISTMSTNGAVGIKDEGSSISTGVKNINFVGATVTATNSGDDVTVNVSAGTGTVTSVAATVPSVFSISGSPITTSGTLALTYSGTALPVVNGGTGVTTSTGSGNNVLSTSPTLVTPALGTPSSGVVTNLTGTASININGTVGATTPATGAFTTLSATGTLSGGTSGTGYSFSGSAPATSLTLNASGNLGIGVTPSTSNTAGASFLPGTSTVASMTGSNGSGQLLLGNNGGGSNLAANDSCGMIAFKGRFNSTFTGGSDIASIIGTYTGNGTTRSGAIRFLTLDSGTEAERARIDSSGNLLVGAGITSSINGTFCPIQALNNTDNQVAYFRNSNANPYGTIVNYSGASPNNTGNDFVYCSDSTAQRASLRSNGGLANYSANNSNLSDRREKTNFAPASSYLDKICAIPVQTFNYVDQNLEEDAGLTLGVVAQDVQTVAPELVTEGNWGTKENPKMRFEIYQTDLQYALMKCIQEQQALITQLTARITALETA